MNALICHCFIDGCFDLSLIQNMRAMNEIMSTQNRTQEHDIHHTISGGMVDTASTLWSTLPHSLAAGRVQLKLLENAIFKAEQELEAGMGGAGCGQKWHFGDAITIYYISPSLSNQQQLQHTKVISIIASMNSENTSSSN